MSKDCGFHVDIAGASFSEEDARRVVSCVNACVGIETKTLELIGRLLERSGRPWAEPLTIIDGLRQNRDALLETMKRILEYCDGTRGPDGFEEDPYQTIASYARAAIARASGS